MRRHLNDDEIANTLTGTAAADVQDHLAECVSCRHAVTAFRRTVEARRRDQQRQAPDWAAQRAAVMAALPAAQHSVAPLWRRAAWRPLLAVAAMIVLAIGVTALWDARGTPTEGRVDDLPVAQILAEAEALLSDDRIPGFEAIQWESTELGLMDSVPTPATTS